MESLNGDINLKSVKIQEPKYPVPESLRRPILIRPRVLMCSGPATPAPRATEVLSKPIMGLYNAETYQVKKIVSFYFCLTESI